MTDFFCFHKSFEITQKLIKSGDIVSYNFSILTDDSSNQTHEVVNSTSVGSDQVLIASNEKVLLQTTNVPVQTEEGTIVMAKVLLDIVVRLTDLVLY